MQRGRKAVYTRQQLPRSVTNMSINLTGLLSYLVTLRVIKEQQVQPFLGSVISIAVLAAVIILLERIFLKTYKRSSTGLSFQARNQINGRRVITKLIGLYGTFAWVACVYWLFPEYQMDFYQPYWNLLKQLVPAVVVAAIPYFILMDRYMQEPRDSYWHMGKVVLGQWKEVDKAVLKNHFLGWLVKTFFLALMFPYLMSNTGFLIQNDLVAPGINFGSFYEYMYNLIFAIDLVFVCVGYLLTIKIFDSHIRSAEPSILGWMVAIICYRPFWGFVSGTYLKYDDGHYWGHWLADIPQIYNLWGSVILLLFVIYVLATIAFGLRFSNLTHRGIITNGPYRYMKHPAYVSKNIAWWLISVPYISQVGPEQAIKHCILMLGVNVLYYVRAITEERHLSLDSVYVKYATMMNEVGIFSKLYQKLPVLKYNPDRYVEDGKLKKLGF